MIAALTGIIASSSTTGTVHLQCGPVMLELTMPGGQAARLMQGEQYTLYTHMYLATTSDTLRLYGFIAAIDRDLFATLITGPGVGPRVALALMELGTPGLVAAILDADDKLLTSVKGVGPKLAKKIILELSDKLGRDFATQAAVTASGTPATPADEDALAAVVALGYTQQQAAKGLEAVRSDYDGDDVSELIRKVLAKLAR
jgi:Holliday junction DNA helicase RuvA